VIISSSENTLKKLYSFVRQEEKITQEIDRRNSQDQDREREKENVTASSKSEIKKREVVNNSPRPKL